jgi:hypothetical protein
MIKFFSKIRKNLIKQNRAGKYLLYAIGEIVLVVIGILIALGINNNNELNKLRKQELHYLANIKTDLQLNKSQIEKYMATRATAVASAQTIVEHYEGKPLTDLEAFNVHTVNIYTWRKFFQNNNTFQELVNSGNLALISNDSIKNLLLNMESLYLVMKDQEAHFRYDAEILLYEPQYKLMDMFPIVQNYTYQVSNGQAGSRMPLSQKKFDAMLQDTVQKNGFVMAIYEFSVMNGQFEEMKAISDKLIALIDKELLEEK